MQPSDLLPYGSHWMAWIATIKMPESTRRTIRLFGRGTQPWVTKRAGAASVTS